MSLKPVHHELPRLYLRGFCEPDSARLWLFRHGMNYRPGTKPHLNNPVIRGLRQVGHRQDRYAARDRAGRVHDNYERLLQKQEHLADEVLFRARRRDALVEADKFTLARYVILTLRRLTSRDEALRPALPLPGPLSPQADIARSLAANGRFADARAVVKMNEWLSSPDGQVELLRESMLQPMLRVEALLLSRRWQFLVAPHGSFFVTCDRPVVYDRRGLQYPPLLFPLGADVMLVAGVEEGRDDMSYREATTSEVERLNFLVLFNAQREVYSPEASQWIHDRWCEILAAHRSA